MENELVDITTGELLDEMIVRIECTNGLQFISNADIAKLVTLLSNHLATK